MSLIGYARINKRSELVCEAIQEMYDQNKLNFSFEISAGDIRIENGISIVDASENNELTAMAVVSIPAYPESKALDLVAEAEIDIERFYENANVLISEMDFETVRERFFEYLYSIVDHNIPFCPKVLLFCPDCVIFYEYHLGKTYKAEYLVDEQRFVIKDMYEISFERSKVGEDNMNMEKPDMNQEMESVAEVIETEAAIADVEVAEVENTEAAETEVVAEGNTEAIESVEVAEEQSADEAVSEADTRIAELQNENAELRAQIEELQNIKAELERMKAEREEAEKKAERAKLAEFAASRGLDVENEVIAEAIKNLDHKAIIAEMMVNEASNEAKVQTKVAMREDCDIKPTGNSYLFERV